MRLMIAVQHVYAAPPVTAIESYMEFFSSLFFWIMIVAVCSGCLGLLQILSLMK